MRRYPSPNPVQGSRNNPENESAGPKGKAVEKRQRFRMSPQAAIGSMPRLATTKTRGRLEKPSQTPRPAIKAKSPRPIGKGSDSERSRRRFRLTIANSHGKQ